MVELDDLGVVTLPVVVVDFGGIDDDLGTLDVGFDVDFGVVVGLFVEVALVVGIALVVDAFVVVVDAFAVVGIVAVVFTVVDGLTGLGCGRSLNGRGRCWAIRIGKHAVVRIKVALELLNVWIRVRKVLTGASWI